MKRLISLLVLASSLLTCRQDQPALVPTPPTLPTYSDDRHSIHLLLGNPTQARTNPEQADNLLLIKDQYVLSYNRSFGRPNWVAWHLGANDLGLTDRQDDFRPDASLPAGWYPVKPTDYTDADGFDRGHLCPSADRTNTEVENSATFLMTNIVPQAPTLNRGVWAELENYCRQLVEEGNELYIVAGGYGEGATGSKGFKNRLATAQVTAPSNCWKVILALPAGDNDLIRIDAGSTVIAVNMLNAQSTRNGWEDYIVSISDIEKLTRYTFLSAVPEPLRTALKTKIYRLSPAVSPPATSTVTPPTSTTVTPPNAGTTTPPSTTPVSPPQSATSTPPGSTTATPAPGEVNCGFYNGKKLYRGPKGGCYYINGNGNKTYVDRSFCSC